MTEKQNDGKPDLRINGIRVIGPDEKLVIQIGGSLTPGQYQAAASQINDLLDPEKNNRVLICDDSVEIFVLKGRQPDEQPVQIEGSVD